MTYKKYKASNVIDALEKSMLHPDTIDALRIAFIHGGYVTGGFARMFINHQLFNDDENIVSNTPRLLRTLNHQFNDEIVCDVNPMFVLAVDSHLKKYYRPQKNTDGDSTMMGDIDIIFQDKKSCDTFRHMVKHTLLSNERTWFRPSHSYNCEEFFINGHEKFQVLMLTFAKIEKILDAFDIANCQCAFNHDTILINSNALKLEQQSTLDVIRWGPATPYRVLKYVKEKGLQRLTPETEEKFVSFIINLCMHKNIDVMHKFDARSLAELQLKLSSVLKTLNTQNLNTLLGLLPPYGGYSSVLNELHKRNK